MTARIIAFEGIDGSGKGTQSRLLADSFKDAGQNVSLISFPRYSATRFGRAIGDFLNGRYGELDNVSPWLASMLYAGDRFESRSLLEEAVDTRDVVILDRYVASNIAHQGARVEPAQRGEIIDWIEGIEYEVFGLPKADQVVLLDVPVNVSQDLISRKAPRDYTDAAADLQESNVPYLAAVREVYAELSQRKNWRVVNCVGDGEVRGIDVIHDEIRALTGEAC